MLIWTRSPTGMSLVAWRRLSSPCRAVTVWTFSSRAAADELAIVLSSMIGRIGAPDTDSIGLALTWAGVGCSGIRRRTSSDRISFV